MSDEPRFLAIVPARGGSKRVPRKNLLPLAGRPLIAWTISAALDSGKFTDVLVSTDDQEIAEAAQQAHGLVPWLRPDELSTDTASSQSVLRHALEWYEAECGAVSAVVLLQPTSPFRSVASIQAAIAAYRAQPDAALPHSVVSVSPALPPPNWCFNIVDGAMQPVLGWEGLARRSQELPAAYALNGAIYVIPSAQLKDEGPLLRPGMRPFVMMDGFEALDIDTPEDWLAAQAHAAQLAASYRAPIAS